MNKCDVLKAKLKAGTRLGKFVISYGDRPNDFENASECEFLGVFLGGGLGCEFFLHNNLISFPSPASLVLVFFFLFHFHF